MIIKISSSVFFLPDRGEVGDFSHPEEGNTLEGDSYHHSHQTQAWNI